LLDVAVPGITVNPQDACQDARHVPIDHGIRLIESNAQDGSSGITPNTRQF
jgi:hypothetical protein